MGIVDNIKKRGTKDIFSKRVFAYIESLKQKFFGVWTKKEDQIAYAEQIIFKGAMCPECKANGSCIHCGCNFDDLAMSKVATCSDGRWGKVLNNKKWKEYKDKYLVGIDFGFIKKRDGDSSNNKSI